MAHKKKTSLSQKVVSASASGMPAPVQKFVSGRLTSKLIVLVVPLLFAFGLLTLDWENGLPKLSIDREKAEEVKEQAVEKLHQLEEQYQGDADSNLLPAITSLGERSGIMPAQPSTPEFDFRPAERVSEFAGSLSGERSDDASLPSPVVDPDKKSLFGNGPLSGLRKRIDIR